MLINGEKNTCIRMADFLGIIPAINGKVELVYEGEQEGAEQISYHLISQACKTLFPTYFPEVKKLEKQDEKGPYDKLLGWFFSDNELFLEDTLTDGVYRDTLEMIPDIKNIVKTHQSNCGKEDLHFMMEFLLWGLEANKRLNKYRTLEGFQFKDSLGSYISGL
jgi:magnesium chelatase subunit I